VTGDGIEYVHSDNTAGLAICSCSHNTKVPQTSSFSVIQA